MAKEGSTVGGLMDCFGTAISICLQYGVPLEVLVNKFSHTRFEPMGFTSDPDIRIAKSLVDYIFRWLGKTFLPAANTPTLYAEMNDLDDDREDINRKAGSNPLPASQLRPISAEHHGQNRNEQFSRFQGDAPACDNCGAITVRNGNCYLCYNCGNSLGCS